MISISTVTYAQECDLTNKQYEMDSFDGWDTAPNGSVQNLAVQDGVLSYDIDGVNPYLRSATPLGLCTETNRLIKVSLKNQTIGTSARMYFKMNEHNAFAGNSVTISIAPNSNEFIEYTFDMSAHLNWVGVIKELRIDLPVGAEVTSGRVEIDYIRLESGGCQPQSILYEQPGIKSTEDTSFTLVATSTSGLSVSASIISGPATINGMDVTLTGEPGKVILLLEQEGNETFCTAKNEEITMYVKGDLWDTYSDTWVGADELGRVLPTANEVGTPRDNKHVSIFYHIWHRQRSAIYDITKILEANPTNPQYGPVPQFHHDFEPYLGYYLSVDEFVIRKHVQMLIDAGVEVIILDQSNNDIHETEYQALVNVYSEMFNQGINVPKIVTFTNDALPVQELYDNYYSNGLYQDLWYYWKGKPLILAKTYDSFSAELLDFFSMRESWAISDAAWFENGKDKWPWLDMYPQPNYGWHEDPSIPEAMSVSAGFRVNGNVGRSFHNGIQPEHDEYFLPLDHSLTSKGFFFQDQWDRAIETDPEMIFCAGFNEFTAQHAVTDEDGPWINFAGEYFKKDVDVGRDYFIALFNQEYSREIEPAKTGIVDNYYYQLISNIRKYKGVRSVATVMQESSITINDDFSQWNSIANEYRDDIGDITHRNEKRFDGKEYYVNTSGRNDIKVSKVISSNDSIYFYVETTNNLTEWSSEKWMWLLINTDADYTTGWHGYDYIINHDVLNANKTILKANENTEFSWNNPVEIDMAYTGNKLHLKIAKSDLGITNIDEFSFDFKWADNSLPTGDIMEFIDMGDAAPNARFNYRYSFSNDEIPTEVNTDTKGLTEGHLVLSPNPASDLIQIQFRGYSQRISQLAILDVNGSTRIKHTIGDPNQLNEQINISNLPTGLYFVRVLVDGKILCDKFIKR
jgi:hypothetical protein